MLTVLSSLCAGRSRMQECVFLAGASGVIGRIVGPKLVAEGWRVVGVTRRADKVRSLEVLGLEMVVVDVFDGAALSGAVLSAEPDIVMHQLTDLPAGLAA